MRIPERTIQYHWFALLRRRASLISSSRTKHGPLRHDPTDVTSGLRDAICVVGHVVPQALFPPRDRHDCSETQNATKKSSKLSCINSFLPGKSATICFADQVYQLLTSFEAIRTFHLISRDYYRKLVRAVMHSCFVHYSFSGILVRGA